VPEENPHSLAATMAFCCCAGFLSRGNDLLLDGVEPIIDLPDIPLHEVVAAERAEEYTE
jgi:hypothetical protein